MQLNHRQPDGATLQTHLQRLASSTGRVDEMLLMPEVPSCVSSLWEAYLSMVALRRVGMGAQPLVMSDVAAWSQLNGVRFTPWELDTLICVDAAAMRNVQRSAS